jgi:hypothetical protein
METTWEDTKPEDLKPGENVDKGYCPGDQLRSLVPRSLRAKAQRYPIKLRKYT